MQQNMQYGTGYHASPPNFGQASSVAPDYGTPYGAASSFSQSPSPSSMKPYTSVPSYEAPFPAQNLSDPSYYGGNHPYAPQAPTFPVSDPSFNSPNSAYLPTNALYGPSLTQNPTGPPLFDSPYDSSANYGHGSLPQSVASSALPSQAYGSNSTPYRSGSFPEEFSVSKGSPIGYAEYSNGTIESRNSLGYDRSNPGYLQGRGFETSGFEQLGSHGQTTYNNAPQDAYNYADAYAYNGVVEPYGSRGTRSVENASVFNPLNASGNTAKVARPPPKSDADLVGNGVQKYRVKLLPETNSSDPSTDVICQIGLDGIHMLVPGSNKLLRIYPLETITKWEVSDSSTFTFWAKTSVDVEQRRIRLQSNSYTTSAILDTVTAACVQLCEMVDKETPLESSKGVASTSGNTDPGSTKKSSFADWVTLKSKAGAQEEKQHWVPDEAATKCSGCGTDFGAFVRRHHCRNCGDIFCDKCTRGRTPLTSDKDAQPVRVCDRCLAEATQRLTNMEPISKPVVQRRHEDLAKKLQEEIERNAVRKQIGGSSGEKSREKSLFNCRKCGSISLTNSGSNCCPSCGADISGSFNSRVVPTGTPDSSGLQGPPHLWSNHSAHQGSGSEMRDVACPTCTVHLQVRVPSFGSETVECGVCQHPFLVNAR